MIGSHLILSQGSRWTHIFVDVAKISNLKVELSPITSMESTGPDEKYLFFENLVQPNPVMTM